MRNTVRLDLQLVISISLYPNTCLEVLLLKAVRILPNNGSALRVIILELLLNMYWLCSPSLHGR